MEMIATMIYKLTKDATPEQLKAAGLGAHYAAHDSALFYTNAAGVPWTASYIQAKGDPIADLYEDIAAGEKARATYQWLIDLTDDVDLQDSLKFLREREIVHSLRFREAVEIYIFVFTSCYECPDLRPGSPPAVECFLSG